MFFSASCLEVSNYQLMFYFAGTFLISLCFIQKCIQTRVDVTRKGSTSERSSVCRGRYAEFADDDRFGIPSNGMDELSHSLFSSFMSTNSLFILHSIFQGDLGFYLQKKGRLSPSKALRFALDIARHVRFFSYWPEWASNSVLMNKHIDILYVHSES